MRHRRVQLAPRLPPLERYLMRLAVKVLLWLALAYVLIASVRWLAFNRVQENADACREELNVIARFEQTTDDTQRLVLAAELAACAQSRAGWFERIVFYSLRG